MEVKPAFEAERLCLSKESPLPYPIYIIIDTSEVCNLKCNYCFRSKDHKEYGYALKNQIMSMEVFKKTADSIATFSEEPRKISLSASGEPLANKNIPEMVKYLKERVSTPIELYTNGLLLDEQYAKKLAESNIDKIIVSLQGLTSEKYKQIAGKTADIDRLCNSLKVLCENSNNTKVFVKVANIALDDEKEEQVFLDMFKDCCHYAYVEKIIDNFWDINNKGEQDTVNRFGLKVPYQRCCSQPFMMVSVAPNGDIYPCCQPLAPVNFGNIQDISLKDSWDSKARIDFLKKNLSEKGRAGIKFCHQCEMAQGLNSIELDSLEGHQEDILKRIEERYEHCK